MVAAIATVYTVAMPLLLNDSLEKRMKAVALERDQIRTRERERLARQGRGSLRQRPGEKIRSFVDRFKLSDWLGTEDAKRQLVQAGFRGQKAEYTFLGLPAGDAYRLPRLCNFLSLRGRRISASGRSCASRS